MVYVYHDTVMPKYDIIPHGLYRMDVKTKCFNDKFNHFFLFSSRFCGNSEASASESTLYYQHRGNISSIFSSNSEAFVLPVILKRMLQNGICHQNTISTRQCVTRWERVDLFHDINSACSCTTDIERVTFTDHYSPTRQLQKVWCMQYGKSFKHMFSQYDIHIDVCSKSSTTLYF